ncbi:VC0807 family protein [Streptomyces sp. TP-A0356]|uniref:VC0807 family protein n=1 Tax=Streptomyces sp. TP-A0356 TaxID=1359208 RepID=UPI0006E1BBBA|nr:VC0807 family protein [Streptomyces sp. TP-A0356]
MTVSTATEGQVRHARGIIGVLPYLLDIIVPLVSYYVLTSVGLSPFWSLLIGGALTTIVSIINTIRRGKIDNLGVLVIVEIALGLVLDLAVRDPRLTLARGSLFIALAGIWILVNTFTGRPITVDATKPFAARKGGTDGIIAFEWLAQNSQRFLRVHRSLSTVWSVMFLAYATMRVVVVYSVTTSEAVWLTEVPGIVAVAICLIASGRAGKQLEALVNDRMKYMSENPA